ncbi:MAG: hypothetical protein WCF16_01735, partial [Alphaproteobacteria bacterium]
DATLFADTLNGGNGADTLDGGLGNDLLTGGGAAGGADGADTFEFSLHGSTVDGGFGSNDGSDTVLDFNRANDVLKFTDVMDVNGGGVDITDLAASIHSITSAGGNTTIAFENGASVQLNGVTGGGIADVTATTHTGAENTAIQADIEAIVNGAVAHILVSG